MRSVTRAASAALVSLLLAAGGLSAANAAPADEVPEVSAEELSDSSSLLALINPSIKLPEEDYHPKGLRNVAGSGDQLRDEAADAVEDLVADARKAGHPLKVISAFRSYERQQVLFNQYQTKFGTEYAERISARPGTSEHQLGLAADVGYSGSKCELHACFGQTPAGKWIAEHAVDYGLIVRYPEGEEKTTGYRYEPWHLRYIGTEHAQAMKKLDMDTFEEYFQLLVENTEQGDQAAQESAPSSPAPSDKEDDAASQEASEPSPTPTSLREPEDLMVLRFLPPFRDWAFGLGQ